MTVSYIFGTKVRNESPYRDSADKAFDPSESYLSGPAFKPLNRRSIDAIYWYGR